MARGYWDEVDRAKVATPKTVRERRDRLLRLISDHTPMLGQRVQYKLRPSGLRSLSEPLPETPTGWHLMSFYQPPSQSNLKEVEELIAFASGQGLILDDRGLTLTFNGHSHLEQIKTSPQTSLQAFVAMWFSGEVASAYDHGIEPAIRQAGYKVMRIDRKEHNNKIDDEIIAEIRRSRFLVADFTCGVTGEGDGFITIPRGGVIGNARLAKREATC